jgi:outer membrane protein OmpA-like peptidoglycan-associated protein
MFNLPRWGFLVSVLLLVITGCAGKNTLVVLVPDTDGKTGRITVANQGGMVEISSPNQGTTIKGINDSPTTPADMDKAKIESMFSDVISMQPKRPVHFTLYFAKDASLTAESEKLLSEILLTIKERSSTDITVVGHTDTVGSREFNLTLSRERANAVKEILVKKGVAADSIATTSHGKENPLIPTADNVNEPRNRRAEVVVR